jgi:hypothetical protein
MLIGVAISNLIGLYAIGIESVIGLFLVGAIVIWRIRQ